MKINTEQLRALQEAEAQRVKPQTGAVGFNDLFARHLDKAETAVQDAGSLSAPVRTVPFSPLAEVTDENTQGSTSTATTDAVLSMDRMFTDLERYAAGLADNSQGSLREAWSVLGDLRSQVSDFKDRYPNAVEEQPELAALVNEVDVLAVTEAFKFNRGDYY